MAGCSVECVLDSNYLDENLPRFSNSDEDLLSNCSTECAGSSSSDRKKNAVFSAHTGCQCSNLENQESPNCSPSARRILQKGLPKSPTIGVALTNESGYASAPEPTERCAESLPVVSKSSITRLIDCLKESRTYRPELWEVDRAVCELNHCCDHKNTFSQCAEKTFMGPTH